MEHKPSASSLTGCSLSEGVIVPAELHESKLCTGSIILFVTMHIYIGCTQLCQYITESMCKVEMEYPRNLLADIVRGDASH